jgi:hypothetical protein
MEMTAIAARDLEEVSKYGVQECFQKLSRTLAKGIVGKENYFERNVL